MKTKTKVFHIILLIVLGITVYANSRNGAFVWDDYSLVKNNVSIRSWKLIPQLFTRNAAVSAFNQHHPYRPVVSLTYMADYSFWKLNPLGYHLTNIFLHICVVLCLYGFIMLLFGNGTLALGTAALFLVHPVHVEAVAYISGRNDALVLLFMLLAFIFYIKRTQARSLALYCLVLLSYSLALLSKENAFIFPALLLLYHYVFKKKIKLLDFISVVSLAGVFVFLRMTLLKSSLLKVSLHESVLDRLPGVFAALVNYLRLLLAPFDLHMDYGNALFSWIDPKVLLGVVIFLGLLVVGFRKRKKDALITFGIGWFFLAFLPVSNIYALSFYMAEHWLYIPSIGFFLILMHKILTLSQTKKLKIFAQLLFAGLLCFYSFATIQQNQYWRDPVAFYQRTMRFSPDTAGLYNNLGIVYEERGAVDQAVSVYQKAIELDPRFIKSYSNLGRLYNSLGKTPEAIALYQEAIRINPDYFESYNGLAAIYAVSSHPEEAIELCKKAIQLNPNEASSYYNLGHIYLGLDRYEEAITAFQKALLLDPGYVKAYDGLGFAYHNLGRYDDGIDYLKKAIKLNPGYASAYYNLASVYKDKKLYEEAALDLKKAQEIEPQNIEILMAFASLYRTMGRFQEALSLYQKALALDPANPVLYFNLGNVCLDLERWPQAINRYKKALELNPEFAQAYENLAVAYLHQEQYQPAIEAADKATHLGIFNPELLEALKNHRKK